MVVLLPKDAHIPEVLAPNAGRAGADGSRSVDCKPSPARLALGQVEA